MLKGLFVFPCPQQREQYLILLFAPCSARSAFARANGSHRVADFPPQMRPIQDLDRIGKVFAGLAFDPCGSICEYDLAASLGCSSFTSCCIAEDAYVLRSAKCR